MAVRTRMNTQRLVELHDKGMSDRELAERMGVSVGTILYYRKKLGLEVNRQIARSSAPGDVSDQAEAAATPKPKRQQRVSLASPAVPAGTLPTLPTSDAAINDLLDVIWGLLPRERKLRLVVHLCGEMRAELPSR